MKNLKKDQKTFIYLILFILIVTVLSSCGQRYVVKNINNNNKRVVFYQDDIYNIGDTVFIKPVCSDCRFEISPDSTFYNYYSDKYIIIKKY